MMLPPLSGPVKVWYPPFAFASHKGCTSLVDRWAWRTAAGEEISVAHLRFDSAACLRHFTGYAKSMVVKGVTPRDEVVKLRWAGEREAHVEVRSADETVFRHVVLPPGHAMMLDADHDSYPEPGEGKVAPSRDPHQKSNSTGVIHESFQIQLAASLYLEIVKGLGVTHAAASRVRFNPVPRPLGSLAWIDSVVREMLARPERIGATALLEGVVAHVVVRSLREFPNTLKGEFVRDDPASRRDVRVERVVEYLHRHFQEPLTLDRLIAEAAMGRANFLHLFKRELHTTPMRMLLNLRLKRTQHLLRTTNLPVRDIAEQTGFITSDRLAAAFRNRLKMSPLAYRLKK